MHIIFYCLAALNLFQGDCGLAILFFFLGQMFDD